MGDHQRIPTVVCILLFCSRYWRCGNAGCGGLVQSKWVGRVRVRGHWRGAMGVRASRSSLTNLAGATKAIFFYLLVAQDKFPHPAITIASIFKGFRRRAVSLLLAISIFPVKISSSAPLPRHCLGIFLRNFRTYRRISTTPHQSIGGLVV